MAVKWQNFSKTTGHPQWQLFVNRAMQPASISLHTPSTGAAPYWVVNMLPGRACLTTREFPLDQLEEAKAWAAATYLLEE